MSSEPNLKCYSLRTLLLGVTGFGILCRLVTAHGPNPLAFYTLLVVAIAVPVGSYTFDVTRSRRSALALASVAAGAIVLLYAIPGLWIARTAAIAQSGGVGRVAGKQLDYASSDNAYFDRFSIVLYTGTYPVHPRTYDRTLVLPEYVIAFPDDMNAALVDSRGGVRFCHIPEDCFLTRDTWRGGAYFLFIPFPRFRSCDFKDELDVERLKGTQVWRDVIFPFLFWAGGTDNEHPQGPATPDHLR